MQREHKVIGINVSCDETAYPSAEEAKAFCEGFISSRDENLYPNPLPCCYWLLKAGEVQELRYNGFALMKVWPAYPKPSKESLPPNPVKDALEWCIRVMDKVIGQQYNDLRRGGTDWMIDSEELNKVRKLTEEL